jgi:hypothetical protein
MQTTYGQYDNGANVFDFYDNFAGHNLNVSKWSESLGSGGSVSVDNGLTIIANSGNGGGSDTGIYSNPGQVASSSSLYVELLGEVQFNGFEEDLNLHSASGAAVGSARDSQTFFTYTYCNGYTDGSSTSINQNTLYLFSLDVTPSSSNTNIYSPNNYYVDYSAPTTSSSVSVGTSCFGAVNALTIQDGHTVIWIRTRAYPPNGIMPAANFGSVQ